MQISSFWNTKASDASKELQRHFRQGFKFQNFGCAQHTVTLHLNVQLQDLKMFFLKVGKPRLPISHWQLAQIRSYNVYYNRLRSVTDVHDTLPRTGKQFKFE